MSRFPASFAESLHGKDDIGLEEIGDVRGGRGRSRVGTIDLPVVARHVNKTNAEFMPFVRFRCRNRCRSVSVLATQ